MAKNNLRFTRNIRHIERCFSWNGSEDRLKERIERSNFIKDVRSKLKTKKISIMRGLREFT